jgi:hypothetical protein
VPESPRWQFIHGHNEKAEELVAGIEEEIEKETGQQLDEVTDSITIRQRKSIGFRSPSGTCSGRCCSGGCSTASAAGP